MDDRDQGQDRYIHLKEISVDFIKRRPTSVFEVTLKDHAGVKYRSNKFKQGDLVHWNIDTYVRTHTSATLTIRRALFNISIVDMSVQFGPNGFGDDKAVRLEDKNHRVTVNFVCGRSQSLADVTRFLGSQARTTALGSKFLRFVRLHQLAALPPQKSERGYESHDVLHAAIHRLNDDVLLEIFNHYRLDEENGWNDRLGWCKLSRVCQRWRHLIYESTLHLGMQIRCTNGDATVDALDHLPPLPLVIEYRCTASVPIAEKDESGIYHALRLRDRIRQINLLLPPSMLHKCLVLMDGHFPILEHLSLY